MYVVISVPSRLFWFAPIILLLLLNNKTLNVRSLGKPENNCFPHDLTLSVYYLIPQNKGK